MKKKPSEPRDFHERRMDEARQQGVAPEPTQAGAHGVPVEGGAPESKESRETFPQRTRKPGHVGLANEARPGLGTRGDGVDASTAPDAAAVEDDGPATKPEATEHGYEEPAPPPREQPSDSLEHEQERSTGVSGQSSGG